MSSAPGTVTSARFQGWELRPLERVLLVQGAPVAIGSRAFDVLLALVVRAGQLVSKAELLEAAWPGLVVEENNISVQIATLRRVLGPQAISTVAGRGYRLSALPLGAPGATALPPGASESAAIELVGRDADLQALLQQVLRSRLVTVTGTGGIGKTSLVRALIARPDVQVLGTCTWIDLAPLAPEAPVVASLAKGLGIAFTGADPGHADLLAVLAHRHALVVLDNCEHLRPDLCAFLQQALLAAPNVHWLATSQVPLQLAQEHVFRLSPLQVPAPGAPLNEVRRSGAVALLCRRAQAGDRHFELTEGNQAMVTELCRQLDGLPLAIEMAAALVASVGLPGVHEQLGLRLRLPHHLPDAPRRHHTLGSTLHWTHGLLSVAERKLLRRLEPFVGGFSMAMAQRVGRDPEVGPDALDEWQTLGALGALVEKSLVHRGPEHGSRFYLFESARDFARERLEEAGETTMVRRRHAHVTAELFEAMRGDYERLRDRDWIARYLPERHNVRAALVWACGQGEPDLLARLVAGLGMIDAFVRAYAEIVVLPIPMEVVAQAMPSFRGPALLQLSWAQLADGNREVATELAQRALEDFRAAGDATGACEALAQLVRLYESRPGMQAQAREAWAQFSDVDKSIIPNRTRLWCAIAVGLQYGGERTLERLHDLEEASARCGFETLAVVCRVHEMDELLVQQRYGEVVDAAQRCLAAGIELPRVKATVLHNQAQALARLGRLAEARATAAAALRTLPQASHVALGTFALAAVRDGQWRSAALIVGWIERALSDRHERLDPAEGAMLEETMAQLRLALPAARLAELMAVGAAMPAAEMLAMVLPAPEAVPAAMAVEPSAPPGRVSSRDAA